MAARRSQKPRGAGKADGGSGDATCSSDSEPAKSARCSHRLWAAIVAYRRCRLPTQIADAYSHTLLAPIRRTRRLMRPCLVFWALASLWIFAVLRMQGVAAPADQLNLSAGGSAAGGTP